MEFLTAARDFAEYNVFYALAVRDIKEFDRAIDKLKFFYQNFKELRVSNNYYQLEAILLLHLLSFNNIEDFYTKLEGLTEEEFKNPFIEYVIKLNESIEDGNYRLVFNLKDSCPIQFCEMFLDRIEETLRVEVTRSSEKAYSFLTFKQAMELFRLKSNDELTSFIQKNVEKSGSADDQQIRWKIKNDRIYFDSHKAKKQTINSNELIGKMLKYADDIEKIV